MWSKWPAPTPGVIVIVYDKVTNTSAAESVGCDGVRLKIQVLKVIVIPSSLSAVWVYIHFSFYAFFGTKASAWCFQEVFLEQKETL